MLYANESLGFIIFHAVVDFRNGGTSTLNSPMYRELSSDEESYPSLFVPDMPSAGGPSPQTVSSTTAATSTNNNNEDDDDDEEFTPTPTGGTTSKKSVPKKRKKDSEKSSSKPRKPRVKNPRDSPSKTLVNRFKQNLGEMVRTVSESPLAGSGGSQMARVCVPLFSHPPLEDMR